MPIAIGGKPESDFTDPIGMLGDCHKRILRFLHVLKRLADDRNGGPLSDEDRRMLATSLRYFREAAPKHTADEEQSLFPRLRASNAPGINDVLARIESLEHEHEIADGIQAEVDRLGQFWVSEGVLSQRDGARLKDLVGQLGTLYERHIGLEDGDVFPVAARVLRSSDREAIGAEMAARRGIGR